MNLKSYFSINLKFFSTKTQNANIQKDIFIKFNQNPLSQHSFNVSEINNPPIGNYNYMGEKEEVVKFNSYVYKFKWRLFFYNKKKLENKNLYLKKNNNFFLLKSTQKEINISIKKFNINKLNKIDLAKCLLFYFSFNLPNSWYNQSKILRYIKRLYFFETGYRYNKKVLPNIILKNIYSHSLFNSILRIILLEKKLNKNLDSYTHPFLKNIKSILTDKYDKIDSINTSLSVEIIINFFINLVSSEFLKDNYVFLKEFELELLKIIENESDIKLKYHEDKIKIFLINFFIKDFFFFISKKQFLEYLNYNKELFLTKRNPHSFFLIPK